MRTLALCLAIAAAMPTALYAAETKKVIAMNATAYDFTLTAIGGERMPLSAFRSKVLLITNTASFCGFTPQYAGLQSLYTAYENQGLVVIGIPSGDFGAQEHKSNKEIADFCETRFDINFPLAEKAHVSGAKAIPLYQWAKAQLGADGTPNWNFHKLLIGRTGQAIAGFGSRVAPDSQALRSAIEAALAE
jgi:glutathione peroxidase